MKYSWIRAALVIIIIWVSYDGYGQDLAAIGSEKPIAVSGSFSSTNIFYHSFGLPNRRDPFSYFLSGSLNLSLYGWDIPFSMNYSNQQTTFYQPFNQYGLSPTYKLITAHLGWRSMNFSSYTLAGHTFLGAGVEMNPSKWRIAGMYGRLNKAVAYDTTSAYENPPVYERYGMGFKVGVGSATDYVDLILFKAQDDPNSIASPPAALTVLPGENLVLGINVAKHILKRIGFSGEWALSAYTRNILADIDTLNYSGIYSRLDGIFTPRSSSSYYQAFKSAITYTGNQYSINTTYEYVEPGYQTMGAYFFNNDIENITIGANSQFFQKLSVAGNVGIQRNNLSNDQVNEQKRLISSFNLHYSPSEEWSFSGSYSNFTTNSRRAARLNEIINSTDTLQLEFVQITDNANFSAGYHGKQGENTYALHLNMAYQMANERQGFVVTDKQSQFYSSNIGCSYRIAATDLGLTASFNVNKTADTDFNHLILGPSFAFNKSFYEKRLRATFSTSYNSSLAEGEPTGNIFTSRFNTNYNHEKSNFTISLVMFNRMAGSAFTELTATMGYSYSF